MAAPDAARHGDGEGRALQQARSTSSRASSSWPAARTSASAAASAPPSASRCASTCDPGALVAARREQPRAHRRERRPGAARHATIGRCCSAAPRSSAARRLRGQALRGHARQHRLQQPDEDRAVLRSRGRDADARARADLPGERPASPARSTRLDTAAHVRPAAAARRDPVAAVRRRHRARGGPRRRTARRCSATRASASCCTSRAAQAAGRRRCRRRRRVVEQTFGVDTFQITPSWASDPLPAVQPDRAR